MAVPVITSLSPDSGIADGTDFVYIIGSDFADSVEVGFGAAVATIQGVITEGADRVIIAKIPKFLPGVGDDPNTAIPGVVDVSVQNLDSAGVPVVGEVVVMAGAFTMTRSPMNSNGVLTRVIGKLIQLLRREVADAHLGVAVDYDPDSSDGLRVTMVSKTPSITLGSPRLVQVPFWRRLGRRDEANVGSIADVYETAAPSIAFDAVFGLNIMTDAGAKSQMLNLVSSVARFLKANPWITILKVEDDPSEGDLKMPLVSGDVRSTISTNQRPNVAVWDVTIKGVQVDSGRPLVRSRAVGDVIVVTGVL